MSRRQLIKYVANKRGGVHFDPTRTGRDADAFMLLDGLDGERLGHHVVLMELLGTGQVLSRSDDVERWRRAT